MFPVVKAASYILAHTPDMILHNGTTQTTERVVNPESDYLKAVPAAIRSFDEVVKYAPNQVYIGNRKPEFLKELEMPWYDKPIEDAKASGRFGEIYDQAEFIGWMKLVDVFDLVLLESDFAMEVKEKVMARPFLNESFLKHLEGSAPKEKIEKAIAESGAEPIYHNETLVGCVLRAHEIDPNLNAHVMFENLVVKASGAMALTQLFEKRGIDPACVDYVIECSEEACGDMNQRGGGNFAKSIAEVAGCLHATGSDTRSFCAAPTHALIEAAALVQAGIYKNVVLVAGGATAKLGMNGKDHVKKGYPILEDVVGGFAVLVSENDGEHPVLRTDLVGKHDVGTGSSPQAVITALVADPLDRGGMTVKDVDKYSVEMQNPDITKPAGAGDVPQANYKMIGALGVMRKELARSELAAFTEEHGMPGWAPTQGHIPSGIPYLGFAIDEMMEGKCKRAMIVGKGSLFLGRMTNLFDGVSIVLEQNDGAPAETGLNKEMVRSMVAQAMREFAESFDHE